MFNNKLFSKIITAIVIIAVILQCVCIPSFAAVSYGGKGTKKDPYIVNTAEQLDGMRNNLSAHYKLGNTIDLSSISNFKPIGTLNKPFTGSFTCELNEDKTPKYVIKNLKIVVAETAYVAENASKWEAGLFGCVNGSTISGIYLLDIYVRNEVQGDNRGALIYNTYKPGMDEMSSSALVGHAYSAVIKNCASTGKIDSKSNHCGGLIGRATDTTIMDCYSTVSVKSAGKWSIGGLIGNGENAIIERCFATGNADCGQSQSGGLAGHMGGGSVTDSYATGNTTATKEASTAFFPVQQGYTVDVENCFALGTAEKAYEQGGKINVKNCFVKSGTTHNMTGFTAASVADIKAAFANLPNWDVSGEYPTLTTIGIVKDGSAYQPGEGETAASGGSSSDEGDAGAGSSEESGEDKVGIINDTITKVPDNVEKLTLEHLEDMKTIMAAFNALSDAEYNQLSAETVAKIYANYAAMCPLVLNDLTNKIEEMPEAKKLKAKDVDKVYELKATYDFLNDEYKQYVSPKLVKKLEELVAKADELKKDSASGSGLKLSATETVIVIVLFALIAIIVAINIVLIVLIIRKYRKISANEDFAFEEIEE